MASRASRISSLIKGVIQLADIDYFWASWASQLSSFLEGVIQLADFDYSQYLFRLAQALVQVDLFNSDWSKSAHAPNPFVPLDLCFYLQLNIHPALFLSNLEYPLNERVSAYRDGELLRLIWP